MKICEIFVEPGKKMKKNKKKMTCLLPIAYEKMRKTHKIEMKSTVTQIKSTEIEMKTNKVVVCKCLYSVIKQMND